MVKLLISTHCEGNLYGKLRNIENCRRGQFKNQTSCEIWHLRTDVQYRFDIYLLRICSHVGIVSIYVGHSGSNGSYFLLKMTSKSDFCSIVVNIEPLR